jgi:hypothetical protein
VAPLFPVQFLEADSIRPLHTEEIFPFFPLQFSPFSVCDAVLLLFERASPPFFPLGKGLNQRNLLYDKVELALLLYEGLDIVLGLEDKRLEKAKVLAGDDLLVPLLILVLNDVRFRVDGLSPLPEAVGHHGWWAKPQPRPTKQQAWNGKKEEKHKTI